MFLLHVSISLGYISWSEISGFYNDSEYYNLSEGQIFFFSPEAATQPAPTVARGPVALVLNDIGCPTVICRLHGCGICL